VNTMLSQAARLARVFDARTEDSHDIIDAAGLLPQMSGALSAALDAIKSARYSVNVTRACLLDSVETHGTHGGWLHEESKRLDGVVDELDAAIAKAEGPTS
jgi:hypothetical protein